MTLLQGPFPPDPAASALAQHVHSIDKALLNGADSAGPLLKQILAYYRQNSGSPEPLAECLNLIDGKGPPSVLNFLAQLSPAWRDHAIASVYALLMPRERRKRLGAYFTPPHLVDHLVARLQGLGLDLTSHRLRDPAAGGAAFLVPLARFKVRAWRAAGVHDGDIVVRLRSQLRGREIEADLAKLANALLRRMLVSEFAISPKLVQALELVATGDSLSPEAIRGEEVDHEIGNPPYLRLTRSSQDERQAEFSDIANGRLNLYAMFVRRALDYVPIGGMVGYVIPASFLGGPEFATFRRRILQLSRVLVIDLIEKRSDVFLDATQDACFLVLQRRAKLKSNVPASKAESGVLRANGAFDRVGQALVTGNGEPWKLPGSEQATTVSLLDWGYRGTIGYLVANRQPDRLYARPGKGRYPLIWAKAVSPNGQFDFKRGAAHKKLGWAAAPASAPYIVRTPCVAVQRTSSRGQKRRLNAAVIPPTFVERFGGIIAENHVILLVPMRSDAASPEALAAALNAPGASEQLDRVCGSASISVRLLEHLRLPPRPE